MTNDLITWAENALEGVTDGPWVVVKGADSWWIDNASDTASVASTITNRGPDAEFIAAARSLVPELVSALKAARAENERLRQATDFADSILSLLHYRGLVDNENNRRDVQKASEMLERLRR